MRQPAAQIVLERIHALGRISEETGSLTRTYGSDAMRRANRLVATWMRGAGMAVRQDNIGNLLGTYPARRPNSKSLLLGSHLDTVRNAGKFDGPLGVLLAIGVVENFNRKNIRLPFNLELAAFCDEEGVRFQSTYLGSRVLAGTFTRNNLQARDGDGITLGAAIRNFGGNPGKLGQSKLSRARAIGYVEAHIEQGPVLEQGRLALGVVSAIAGQTRCAVDFIGRAGHAGTVPIRLRRDALCAAAEFTLAVERTASQTRGLVATVGALHVLPGASNVIPGEVRLTLDVRHADDKVRRTAGTRLKALAEKAAGKRRVTLRWRMVHEAMSLPCDLALSQLLKSAAAKHQSRVISLPSGAGHDAVAMAALCPVAMLFIRCKGGISHHPDESVSARDIAAAIETLSDFVTALAAKFPAHPNG